MVGVGEKACLIPAREQYLFFYNALSATAWMFLGARTVKTLVRTHGSVEQAFDETALTAVAVQSTAILEIAHIVLGMPWLCGLLIARLGTLSAPYRGYASRLEALAHMGNNLQLPRIGAK